MKPLSRLELHDRLFVQGKIDKQERLSMLRLRRQWRDGELMFGSHEVAKLIFKEFGVIIPPSTTKSWLGMKGMYAIR